MKPTLPQDDPAVQLRREALAEAREEYVYDRSISDCLFAENVPLRDKGGPRYWAELGEANVRCAANKAATAQPHEVAESIVDRLEGFAAKLKATRIVDHLEDIKKSVGLDTDYPVKSPDDFRRAYELIDAPVCADSWQRDDYFAWMALAGPNPTLLQRLDAVPTHLGLTAERFRSATGDELDAALAAGKVYVSDYSLLEGAVGGKVDDYDKYVCAPIAVFASTDEGLVPVGIQLGQSPDDLFAQPSDGTTWSMAKTAVLASDSQLTGLVGHFGLCHLVVEAVALATKRNLAEVHPLRVLLDAHMQDTLIVNDITRSSLTPVGGAIDRMMAQPREDSLNMVARAVRDFRIMDSAPPDDFARRGVDDTTALPSYPWRDDQLLLWEAIATWIDAYVAAYYASDSEVAIDEELQAFTAELEGSELGGMAGIGRVETREHLAALLARIVFRATVFHAGINYSLYDTGYAPFQPQAQFGPGPTGDDDTHEAWMRMMPPYDIAYEVVEAFYPLHVRINTLGDYGSYLTDPAVADALAAYQSALRDIEATIETRNAERAFPYCQSLPSRISNSIHV